MKHAHTYIISKINTRMQGTNTAGISESFHKMIWQKYSYMNKMTATGSLLPVKNEKKINLSFL